MTRVGSDNNDEHQKLIITSVTTSADDGSPISTMARGLGSLNDRAANLIAAGCEDQALVVLYQTIRGVSRDVPDWDTFRPAASHQQLILPNPLSEDETNYRMQLSFRDTPETYELSTVGQRVQRQSPRGDGVREGASFLSTPFIMRSNLISTPSVTVAKEHLFNAMVIALFNAGLAGQIKAFRITGDDSNDTTTRQTNLEQASACYRKIVTTFESLEASMDNEASIFLVYVAACHNLVEIEVENQRHAASDNDDNNNNNNPLSRCNLESEWKEQFVAAFDCAPCWTSSPIYCYLALVRSAYGPMMDTEQPMDGCDAEEEAAR